MDAAADGHEAGGRGQHRGAAPVDALVRGLVEAVLALVLQVREPLVVHRAAAAPAFLLRQVLLRPHRADTIAETGPERQGALGLDRGGVLVPAHLVRRGRGGAVAQEVGEAGEHRRLGLLLGLARVAGGDEQARPPGEPHAHRARDVLLGPGVTEVGVRVLQRHRAAGGDREAHQRGGLEARSVLGRLQARGGVVAARGP